MDYHPIVDRIKSIFDNNEAEIIINFFDLYSLPVHYNSDQFDQVVTALLLIKSKGHITKADDLEYKILLYHGIPVLKMLGILYHTTEDSIRDLFISEGIYWKDLIASMNGKCTLVSKNYDSMIEKPVIKRLEDMEPITSAYEVPFNESNLSKVVNMLNGWLSKTKNP